MLRRNFLKLFGLVPFVSVTKLVSNEPKEEKWYAIVGSSYHQPGCVYSNSRFEIELESGCIPKPHKCAFVGKEGKCHTARVGKLEDWADPIIGIFLTERYQKDVKWDNERKVFISNVLS